MVENYEEEENLLQGHWKYGKGQKVGDKKISKNECVRILKQKGLL